VKGKQDYEHEHEHGRVSYHPNRRALPRPLPRLRILILKPSSLGDVIHALPVLRLLKRHLPQSEIYWWLSTALTPLLEGDRDLTAVIPFERRRWAAPRNWVGLWDTIRKMRELKFDWVIDLQSLARSGAVAWLANGQLTVGLDSGREVAAGYYDLLVRRPSPQAHAVDWYLAVLSQLGVPANGPFDWLPSRPQVAKSLRQQWPVSNRRWLILQPGARWATKRWPAESFAELARGLATLPEEFQIAILGGPDDRALGETIYQAAPARCLDLTGKLSLPEMVEWIRLSELMITNDTGPMHVAAALRKPVVALFGPTDPRRTGPYGQLEQVLQLDLPCVPCLKDRCGYVKPFECLRALTPETVLSAVRKRIVNGADSVSGADG
jgi:heptosyltransferase-1